MRSVDRALARCARLILNYRRLVIAGTLIGALLCAGYAASNLGINTSTANMISGDLPWRQTFTDYRESFPALDRNIAVVIDAPSGARADAFSAALVKQLKQRPKLYESVFAARSNPFFLRNGLLYASVQQLHTLDYHLARAQPLLGLLQSGLNGAAVLKVVDRTLAAKGANDSPLTATFYTEVANTLGSAASGDAEPVSWSRLIKGAPTAQSAAPRTVLVQPSLDFSKKQPAAQAIETLHSLIKTLQSEAFPHVDANLTGNLAMQQEEMKNVQQGARWAGLGALVLAAILLYAALRSFKLLAIGGATLGVGLAGTGAFAAATVGQLNLLSAAFAVTYIGLGTAYIVHVCLRVKELMANGYGRDDAIVEAIGSIGSSLIASAATTAVGFYAFIPTNFTGVAELGIISGTGMFISLLAGLTFLPALLGQFLKDGGKQPRQAWFGTDRFKVLTERPGRVMIVTAAIVAVTFAALPHMRFDSNPLHLQDQDSEAMQALHTLAKHGQASMYNIVALAPDHKTALAWAAKLRQLDTVKNVKTVDSLVPEHQQEKLNILADISLIMGPGFGQLKRIPADTSGLELAAQKLADHTAQRTSPALQHLHEASMKLLTQLRTQPENQDTALLTDLDSALVSSLPRQLSQLAAALNASSFSLDSVPETLQKRWITQDGRELVQVAPLEDVSNNKAAARFVHSVRNIVPTATGLPVVYIEASHTIVHAFVKAFIYALIAITVLLWFFLRNFKDLLLAIGPILLATGATLGLAVLLGIPLNFASIIGLPLLVGMNVDNGVHMLRRVRSAPTNNGHALGNSTSLAILVGNLTTTVSFGMLALSPQIGMASFGQMITLGVITTLGASMILLPALLQLRVFQHPVPA